MHSEGRNNMWMRALTRKQLAELIRTDNDQLFCEARELGTGELPSINPDQIGLLWPDKPTAGMLPTVFLVVADQRREFFSWALTYLSDFRPLTAFVRVLT